MLRTNMYPISIIVAVDAHGGFGKDGKIPWNYPEDLQHFQQITKGNVCIMGRKTYEDMLAMRRSRSKKKKKEIIDEILPGRQSFVVTKDPTTTFPGAINVQSIRQAINSLEHDDTREIFVIGGYRMFVEALIWAKNIYLTLINDGKEYECDVFFPLDEVKKRFNIIAGSETDNLQFITYNRVSV